MKSIKKKIALTGVVQLVGQHPADRGVLGSIPGQGTCLGCGFGPQLGSVRHSQLMFPSRIHVSLPFSLPLLPSKISKHVLG